ncbi:MAG: P1 family peptidase [Chloroflexota bacterium]
MTQFNIPGIKIGHATNEDAHTGCTVFLCPAGTVCSVDVRGPAPGSRETAVLGLDKRDIRVNAVVLTGGSAFGLASADGVMRYLGERGIGHYTPIRNVPIVPAAVVYDLFYHQGQHPPTAEMGYQACLNARENNPLQGNVGAGAGVTVGKWAGFSHEIMKGGFGLATATVDGITVSAGAVVNAVGDVVNRDGTVLAGARHKESKEWLVEQMPYRYDSSFQLPPPGSNTTLVVVATNAKLTKPQANRLAQRAHDGMAIAIRPAHTEHDGDTAYALATGEVDAPMNLLGNLGIEVVAEAIRNSVRAAKTAGPVIGLAG